MTPDLAAAIVLLAADSFFLGGASALLFSVLYMRDMYREQDANEERSREHERWRRRCEEEDEAWRFQGSDDRD